eukprot:gnl/TRDRNA2_/TRDRNA2_130218_c0_seq3.p1 gnl/TRDRNA2_/TRDRNA2_130218_c0~~gnl/TRDRNA2_/TRDRNA2_130218_c0_seq3.p1  ORF type:complete len:288 (-),score=91.93 gnl/TRDRNA2_/TRDRNA2_130218_c0_seq3:78-941(-)
MFLAIAERWVCENHMWGAWLQPGRSEPARWAPSSLPKNPRPGSFVPKPYNPEKEFQKRQLRLREKIAAMQKAKVGDVDASLIAAQTALRAKMAEDEASEAAASAERSATGIASGLPPPPPVPSLVEQAAAEQAAAAKAASDKAAAEKAAAETVAAEQAAAEQRAAAEKAAAAKVAAEQAAAQAAAAKATEEERVAAEKVDKAVKQPGPPPGQSGRSGSAVIRWEEALADESGERYYHELATGKVQWELPSEGWVELLADDGSRYYWDPESDITTWENPATSGAEVAA